MNTEQNFQKQLDLEYPYNSQHILASMSKLLKQIYSRDEELVIVDVGAYQGNFTGELLEYFPKAKAILFEPSPASFSALVGKYTDSSSIQVFNLALSNYEDTATFYVLDDAATNSLLVPFSPNQKASEVKVTVKTLDSFWKETQPFNRLDLLKIDTQGNDLKVLQGAQTILEKYAPCILVEVNFIELYQAQDSYHEILQMMQEQGYRLTGIYNTHYTDTGQLAFADLFFVPETIVCKFLAKFIDKFICYDLEYLVKQNQFLQKTCDERLALINTLHQAAQERLNVIEVLDAEVKRLQAKLR